MTMLVVSPYTEVVPDGQYEPASNSCVGCPGRTLHSLFSEKGLPLIDHYAANTMSDSALKRMQEIANGEASRPLLAFDQKKRLVLNPVKIVMKCSSF